jgi:Na+/H+-dicarboxylate symporter
MFSAKCLLPPGMFRTITNIWGDACAVSCVDHW